MNKDIILNRFIKTKSWWESGVKLLAIIMNPINTLITIYTAIIVTTKDPIISVIIALIFVIMYLLFCVFMGYIWQEKGLNKKQSNWELQKHRNETAYIIADVVIQKLRENKKNEIY